MNLEGATTKVESKIILALNSIIKTLINRRILNVILNLFDKVK